MGKRDGVVLTMLDVFRHCARECAAQVLENAAYVKQELPNVQLSDGLRQQAEEVCGRLIGTKHDLITELFDLDDLLALHGLVMAIEDEVTRDPQAVTASILVMESAGNILQAFNRMQGAADGVLRAVQGCPLAG